MLSAISKTTLTLIILALLVSCSSLPEKHESPAEIVNDAIGTGRVAAGKIIDLPVADRSDLPYVPIVTPPEVMRVWIYDHVTPSNDLVMGHWVYVKITDQDWYIKNSLRKSAQDKLPSPPRLSESQKMQTQPVPDVPGQKDPALESLLNAARSK